MKTMIQFLKGTGSPNLFTLTRRCRFLGHHFAAITSVQGALKNIVYGFLFSSLFIVAFDACEIPLEPEEKSITPTTGNTIAEIDPVNSELIWSPDGKEILFTTKSALKAINLSSKSIRLLDDRPLRYKHLQYLNNGTFLYYRTGPIDSYKWNELYRISFSGGTPQLIDNNVEAYVPSPSDSLIAISSADRHSLVIINMNTGTSRAVGFGTPLAFSPDDRRLAYYKDTVTVSFHQFDISTDSTDKFSSDLPHRLDYNDVFDGRWDLEGMKIFYGSFNWNEDGYSYYQCAVINISTGVSKTVPLQRAEWPNTPIWNSQGKRFAVKTFPCAKDFLNICFSWHYSIETCSFIQGSSESYSFGTTSETSQHQLSFSRDGKELAFFKDSSLVTLSLP